MDGYQFSSVVSLVSDVSTTADRRENINMHLKKTGCLKTEQVIYQDAEFEILLISLSPRVDSLYL